MYKSTFYWLTKLSTGYRRQTYLAVDLIFVGWVERNFTDFLVLLSITDDITNRHLNTLQQSRLWRVAITLSVTAPPPSSSSSSSSAAATAAAHVCVLQSVQVTRSWQLADNAHKSMYRSCQVRWGMGEGLGASWVSPMESGIHSSSWKRILAYIESWRPQNSLL